MSHLANFDLIILFFILGLLASWMGARLEFPEPISKFLSVFLLLSLGLKGGHEVRVADDLSGFLPALSIGLSFCFLIPLALFFSLKGRLGVANASAVSAAYGSVSAITLITAQAVLENEGVPFGGYMVAVMALMEVPAILVGIYLYQKFSSSKLQSARSVLLSTFTCNSIVLLVGGFLIGLSMNTSSWDGIAPVVQGCFKGVLAFFLLDIGAAAQKQLRDTLKFGLISLVLAVIVPVFFGSSALILANLVGLANGDQVLVAVLVGSASYIAVPAAVRSNITEANPSLYLALPLGLTFPMNLVFGIPLYIELSNWLA